MRNNIQILKEKRNQLVEDIAGLDPESSKVEIYELHGEISEIDRQIHAIDPSQI